MLRSLAAVILVLALPGCFGAGPYDRCRGDTWPGWGPGDHAVVVCSGQGARTATLVVPDGAEWPVPLLLMLHGGGGSGAQFRGASAMDVVADEMGFAVLYADGTSHRRGGLLHTWNAMVCCGKAFDDQVDDVGFLGGLLEGALERYPIDPQRIGIAGHSNGAMMAYRLAAERSDIVTAVMPVAGAIGGQTGEDAPVRVIPEPSHPVSVLIIHATDDDHVPYQGGHGTAAVDGPRIDLSVDEAIEFWLKADRIEPSGKEGPWLHPDGTSDWVYGPGCRETVVQHIRTEGGHGWPGSRGGLDPAPAGPDASWQIGGFLIGHPRDGSGSAGPPFPPPC